jgi:hypothetical protein
MTPLLPVRSDLLENLRRLAFLPRRHDRGRHDLWRAVCWENGVVLGSMESERRIGPANSGAEEGFSLGGRTLPFSRSPVLGEAIPTSACRQAFGLGGGSCLASISDMKPQCLWAPSQKGLLSEFPQRHRPMMVRPATSKTRPAASLIRKSPEMTMGPLSRIVISQDMVHPLGKNGSTLRPGAGHATQMYPFSSR